MCGIFGIVSAGPIEGGELLSMSRILRHRGPDGEGYLLASPDGVRCLGGPDTTDRLRESVTPFAPRGSLESGPALPAGGVALGHRRLSILDLSPNGHQPMVWAGRFWCTYNGEVYNYRELRDELIHVGYSFATDSDTEVVLAAYAHWGRECVARFNGMWALAIFDLERQTLFLARDRFGIKPLYYTVSNNRLAFASEIKAFTALNCWRARANVPRLLDYLVWSVSDHRAETMFDGVYQLLPGHIAVVDVAAVFSGTPGALDVRATRWYRPEPAASGSDAALELQTLLGDAVRLRMRADVPIGSCLSGGLDSSSIVCLMRRNFQQTHTAGQIRTITAGSAERPFDETRYARAVIGAAGAEGVFVTPDPAGLFTNLSKLVWHQDEPFSSTSIFAQWVVFEAARDNGVVVMLDGQGADETLCGYHGFLGARLGSLFRRGAMMSWAREIGGARKNVGFSALRSLGYTAAYVAPELASLMGVFDARAYADRRWMTARAAGAFDRDPRRPSGRRTNSVLEECMVQLTATSLPMLLRWEDRNSMAFSVEARVPFLDYRVVEYALGLPDDRKISSGVLKAVLREAMRGLVPDEVLQRRDKMGFVTAEVAWMTGPDAPRFRQELATSVDVLSKFLSPAVLSRFDDVCSGRRRFDHRYWRAISAGKWAQVFSVAM